MKGNLATGFFRVFPGYFHHSLFFPLGDGIPELAGSSMLRSQAFIAFLLIPFISFIKRGTRNIELTESPSH
jgi:hypothetical protein